MKKKIASLFLLSEEIIVSIHLIRKINNLKVYFCNNFIFMCFKEVVINICSINFINFALQYMLDEKKFYIFIHLKKILASGKRSIYLYYLINVVIII